MKKFASIVTHSFRRGYPKYVAPNLQHTRLFSTSYDFQTVCNAALEEISDSLHDIEVKCEDADIDLSDGVLNIDLGSDYNNFTWVINKQTPNKQIWWSSPVSGPRRYEYHGNSDDSNKSEPKAKQWKSTKDKSDDLWTSLQTELKTVTAITIQPRRGSSNGNGSNLHQSQKK